MYHRIEIQRFILIWLLLIVSTVAVGAAVNITPLGSPYVYLTMELMPVEVGNPIIINGVIDKSIMGYNPGTAILIVKAPSKSKFDAFTQIAVKSDGTFSYSIPTDVTGTWSVSARYSDEISAVTDVIVNPRTTMLSTTNVLNSYGGPASVGEDLNMYGYLRDSKGVGVGDRSIKYMVAIPPYGCDFCSDEDDNDYLIWETYGTVTTDSSGRYTFGFTPYDRGEYKVKTYFGGDEGYMSSISDVRRVRAN